jgi:two-component system cell cycle sensor histidine kinase/response regulator CckA
MMNVLLVDDEAMIRKMLKLTLQRYGFQVFDASDGASAIALSEEQPIDILVSDIVMREMDGWTLAASLRERFPDLPVLFMSGYPTHLEDGHRTNARWAFLPKPFQPGELVEAISNLVQVSI